ncbi:MAG: hypothetical protein CMQ24_20680, partial [Gammaproteobacteria bacterium]|nr:hypothetical protein [Gammaproteobacteria bacterium]
SCSWHLRELAAGSSFNVEVYEIHDEAAFRKLMSEIPLKKLSVRINDKPETLLVGKYPYTRGKECELVIREGRVGTLRGDAIDDSTSSDEVFHEVVMNPKILSHVLDQFRKSA